MTPPGRIASEWSSIGAAEYPGDNVARPTGLGEGVSERLAAFWPYTDGRQMR